jgi:hypothetical protein
MSWSLLLTMPPDPAHHVNRLECQADFTYMMTVKTIKIQETGRARQAARYLHGSSWFHPRRHLRGASASGFDPTPIWEKSRMIE